MVSEIIVSGLAGGISGLAGSGGLLWWFLQRPVEHRYNEKLEEFRTKLTILAHEHEVRFGTLHQRRVEVIAGVYGRLERLHMAARARAVTKDTSEDATDAVNNRFTDFVTYYYPRAIWLSPELCDMINAVLSHLNVLRVWGERVPRNPELVDKIQELEEEIGDLREPLETEFRSLLAVVRP